MLFIVSDNDMKNRYEQTMLTVSTLSHFNYDMEKVKLRVVENSTHTSYVRKLDDNGDSVFGKVILDFIRKL